MEMRRSIKKLNPHVHVTSGDKYHAALNLGRLTRLEHGGYKLEGEIFATSNLDRVGMHKILDQFMDRLDAALDEAVASRES